VTNDHENTVSVIDAATNTVTTSVKVGKYPKSFGQFIGRKSIGSVFAPVIVLQTANITARGTTPTNIKI
jgi:YVTN family beta-propeller protein